jgi:hypothetical protein
MAIVTPNAAPCAVLLAAMTLTEDTTGQSLRRIGALVRDDKGRRT